jgi:hypothetical protein
MEINYYNSNYKLEYYKIQDIEKSDTQYRKDLMTAWNLKKYDEKELDKSMIVLYNKLKDNQSFKNIFEKVSSHKNLSWLISDDISKLYVLFNYHNFSLIHLCIQDFFDCNDITKENYTKIMNSLSEGQVINY